MVENGTIIGRYCFDANYFIEIFYFYNGLILAICYEVYRLFFVFLLVCSKSFNSLLFYSQFYSLFCFISDSLGVAKSKLIAQLTLQEN